MSSLKAIIIDGLKNSIEEIQINYEQDKNIYDILCKQLDCFTVESLRLDDKVNLLYVDSCGLLKPQKIYLKLKEYPSFLPPKAVIIGYDDEKEIYCSHSIDIQKLKYEIMFLNKVEAKALAKMIDQQNSKYINHPNIIYTKLSELFK